MYSQRVAWLLLPDSSASQIKTAQSFSISRTLRPKNAEVTKSNSGKNAKVAEPDSRKNIDLEKKHPLENSTALALALFTVPFQTLFCKFRIYLIPQKRDYPFL